MDNTIKLDNLQESAPACCPFCEQEKKFLLIKPIAMLVSRKVQVYAGIIEDMKWICLDCLSVDINTMGHAVDIYEYKVSPIKSEEKRCY